MKGKKALVTGGTRGIGLSIAKHFRDQGAEVVITGTRPDGIPPEGVEYLSIDFSDLPATEKFASKIAEMSFDILINNAGINVISPFAEIELDDFLKIQQVNVTAPMLLCRAVIPAMRSKSWGRVVNISSIWGKISKTHRASYATSKFALDGLTASFAAEVASFGILANCVAPGFIETDMTRQILGEDGIRELLKQVPIGRLGQPEEIATFVGWLASTNNTFISGQNIAIDGGFTRV